MRDLQELLTEAADAPAPPSAVTADSVYAGARRRRRTHATLWAAAGVVAVTVVASTVAGAVLSPTGHQFATPDNSAGPPPVDRRGVQWAGAADADHLYAVVNECGPPCKDRLVASDNGGRTWTTRMEEDLITFMTVRGPQILTRGVALTMEQAADKNLPPLPHLSVDGGKTWKATPKDTTPVVTVPAGGWVEVELEPIPEGDQPKPDALNTTLYAVDPHAARMAKLANQPRLKADRVFELPSRAGLWISGRDPQTGRPGVAVSRDAGRTWSEHLFDHPNPNGGSTNTTVATLDGRTVYTVVTAYEPQGKQKTYVYRSTNGGAAWERIDPNGTLPWGYSGGRGYLTTDGTHIVSVDGVGIDGLRLWASRDNGARYARASELKGFGKLDHPVEVSDAGYIAYNRDGVYRSLDGKTFEKITVPLKK